MPPRGMTGLAAEARHQPLHQPHVAEEDARLHRHHRVRADRLRRRRDLDAIELGCADKECFGGDADAGRDGPASNRRGSIARAIRQTTIARTASGIVRMSTSLGGLIQAMNRQAPKIPMVVTIRLAAVERSRSAADSARLGSALRKASNGYYMGMLW